MTFHLKAASRCVNLASVFALIFYLAALENVRGDTLFFLEATANASWFSISNWCEPDSQGNLQQVFRLPMPSDSAVLTTSPVIVDANSVSLNTMIVEPGVAVDGGNFSLLTLETAAGSSFLNSIIEIQSQWNFSGGALTTSTVNIDSGASLQIGAGDELNLNTCILYDIGQVALNAGSMISFTTGTNQFSILPNAMLTSSGGGMVLNGSGQLAFDNNGMVRSDGGTLLIGLPRTVWNNSQGLGKYKTTATNATIEFEFGFNVAAGATNIFSGPGRSWFFGNFSGTNLGLMQIGAIDPQSHLPDPGTALMENMFFGNGQIQVLGSAGMGSTLIWDNGEFDGQQISIDQWSQLNIQGSNTKLLMGSTMNNSGTTTLAANSANLIMDAGSVFNNETGGLFQIQDNAFISGGAGAPVSFFNNLGAVRKDTGTNTSGFLQDAPPAASPIFNNTGSLDVESGTFQLEWGTNAGPFNVGSGAELSFWAGTNIQAAGATIGGSGLVFVGDNRSDLWLGTNLTVQNASVQNGTVDGPGDLTISGSLNLGGNDGGGTLQGSGWLTVDSNATFFITDSYNYLNRNVNNFGQATNSAGSATAKNNLTWNNLAGSVLYLANNGSLTYNYAGAPPVFNNLGDLVESNDATLNWTITNSGEVNIGYASLSINNLFVQNAGSTALAPGATLATPFSRGLIAILGGSVSGDGDLGGLALNSGTIHPGDAPGLLTVANNFTNAADGVLSIEIGGRTNGTQYSVLTGPSFSSVSLAGTLTASLTNDFIPQLGDTFTVMSFPGWSRVGGFDSFKGSHIGNGLVLVPVYTGNGLNLVAANEPAILEEGRGSNGWNLRYQSTAGFTNIIEYTDSLNPPISWQVLTNIAGDGSLTSVVDPSLSVPHRFYRVQFQ